MKTVNGRFGATIDQSNSCRKFKLIVTDGVFSMDGLVAPLDKICDLADKYDALVMVDECHAAGFIGNRQGNSKQRGDGTCRYYNGNIRKALGGAMEVMLPSKKRNYRDLETAFKTVFIFEFAGSCNRRCLYIKVFELLEKDTTLRSTRMEY
jgi:glycine C-acetyltransferase